MKPFLFLLGSSLFVAGTAHAQLGLRVGGSLSKLRTTAGTNIYSSSSSQLGYQVGVTYQLRLTSWLALVPEVQYSDERTTLSEASFAIADVGFEADSRLRLHYLNVPVLVRASLGPFYVEAGPQASLLLGGRQTGTITTFNWGLPATTRSLDQGVVQNNRRFDVGPCVGIGAKLPGGLGVSVRAYRGLLTLNDERSVFDGQHQRQALQASLTYQLPG
ncbi:MAG: PorT family protein [Hymenobacter sp.]|nr:MAG: PorT family protein [Hymenobacter sp.]